MLTTNIFQTALENQIGNESLEPGTYPCSFLGYNPMDCQPKYGTESQYLILDIDEDTIDHNDDFLRSKGIDPDNLKIPYDNEDGKDFLAIFPNRFSLFQFIQDISQAISNEIQDYTKLNDSPGDDSTTDIQEAIDILSQVITHTQL